MFPPPSVLPVTEQRVALLPSPLSGGRARFPMETLPEAYLIGHSNDTKLRDVSTLMNDAWSTDVSLSQWRLENPGCYVHNQQFIYGPMRDVRIPECCAHASLCELLPGVGCCLRTLAQKTCTTDFDCYYTNRLGTNGAEPGGTVKCVNNMCACTIWTPRERFAASVYGRTIYIAGGVTEVTRQVRRRGLCPHASSHAGPGCITPVLVCLVGVLMAAALWHLRLWLREPRVPERRLDLFGLGKNVDRAISPRPHAELQAAW